MTFGLEPPPETCFLEAYHDLGQDYALTVLKFRTTPEVINRIKCTRGDREAFLRTCQRNERNLPEDVRAWFLPAAGEADEFYITAAFDKAYGTSEAVLCYNQKTQIAYFHWFGVD